MARIALGAKAPVIPLEKVLRGGLTYSKSNPLLSLDYWKLFKYLDRPHPRRFQSFDF